MLFSGNFDCKLIRGVEIAEALATVTKAEDLADAFAWFETVYPTNEAQGIHVAGDKEPSIVGAWRHHVAGLGT
jgi:hypothetical protein